MRTPRPLALIALMFLSACGGDGGGMAGPGGGPDDSFAPGSDTTLSGAVSFTRVDIPAGVTVTVTGELRLTVSGPIEIAGTLTGDCVEIEVVGSSTVTVTGAVSNSCAEPPANLAPPLTITGEGNAVLDGADVASSGRILIRNDAGLDGDARPAAGALQPAQDGRILEVRRTRIRADPERASDGELSISPNVMPEPGADGGDIRLVSAGDVVLEDASVVAQDGGNGGRAVIGEPTNATARAGVGGHGGDIRVVSSAGSVFLEGESTLRTGHGGAGGNARAEVVQNPNLEAPGVARAYGGRGGHAGAATLWAAEPLSLEGGNLEVVIGAGGTGGNAEAVGVNGLNAGVGQPAGRGASALAVGGNGGDGTPVVWQGTDGIDFFLSPAPSSGSPTVTVTSRSRTFVGGNGGDAMARAGNGGSGDCEWPHGAEGGDVLASGGHGGDALFDPRDPATPLGMQGTGGLARHDDGNGGGGASCCVSATSPGGPGGDGGDATVTAFLEKHGSEEVPAHHGGGLPGRGENDFTTSPTDYFGVGNGGPGGAPGQPGGTAGDFERPQAGRVSVFQSFEPGAPGGECPPSKTALIEASPFKATVALGNVSGTCGFSGEWDGIEIVDGGDGLVTLRHDLFDRTLEFNYVYDESTGEATPPDGDTVQDAVTFDNGVTLDVELGECRAERASSSNARAPGLTGISRTMTASSESSCSATGGTYTLEQSVEQNASQLVLFFCSLVRVTEN